MSQEALPPLDAMLLILVALALLADALRRAHWHAPLREHLGWAGATALIVLGHRASVTLVDGAQLHFLGAAWLALLLGYPRAMVSMAVVISAQMLWQHAPASAWGLRVLVMGALPICAMWWVVRAARRWLPSNLFVFLLGCGLFGVCAVNVLQVGATALVLNALGGHARATLWNEFLPFGLMLAWGEAWLEGMLTTLLVVYLPGSVRLFDERFYLARR